MFFCICYGDTGVQIFLHLRWLHGGVVTCYLPDTGVYDREVGWMGFFCKIFKQTKNNSTGSGFMCGWKSQHNVFFTITFCQITDWLKRAPLMLPLIVLLYSVKCFELPLCGKCYIKMSYCVQWLKFHECDLCVCIWISVQEQL